MKISIIAAILAFTVIGAIAFGRARQRRQASFSEWAVGGRSLGTLLFWFMNAGEIYTTFAVFGIAGYAWALGAPAYLAFCSVSLSYAVGYWLMPKIWKAGRQHGLVTQADFFAQRYRSKGLGVLTALVGIGALIVYVQIQLVGLGLIVSMTFGGTLTHAASTLIAGVLMVSFVLFAGLRSAAFAAGVKDVLMIVLVVVLAWTVADKVGATSLLDIFSKVEGAHPGAGRFPGIDLGAPTTSLWLMTSALNIALGNWVFPHLFQISYSADSATSIRRNAIWQPIYSLAFAVIILLGFAALVAGTQPPDGNMNAVLLQFVNDKYPQWVIGLLAGTGILLALAPGSVLLLTAGSIFASNVVTTLKPTLNEGQKLKASRFGLVLFAAIAVGITLMQKGSLVSILLGAYSAIGMLAPGVFLAFLDRRTNALGVTAGILAGFAVLLLPVSSLWLGQHWPSVEPGLVAMAINALVTLVVSRLRPVPERHAALGSL